MKISIEELLSLLPHYLSAGCRQVVNVPLPRLHPVLVLGQCDKLPLRLGGALEAEQLGQLLFLHLLRRGDDALLEEEAVVLVELQERLGLLPGTLLREGKKRFDELLLL